MSRYRDMVDNDMEKSPENRTMQEDSERKVMGRYRNIADIDMEKFSKPLSANRERRPQDARTTQVLYPPFISGEALERFIEIREEIFNEREKPSRKFVGVTSSVQKEGKTTVSICLSLVCAMDPSRRVLIVDGNLRSPGIHRFFRIPRSPGIADLIQGDCGLSETIQKLDEFPLHIMAAGNPRLPAVELLAGSGFEKTVDDLKSAFDIIIMDTPSAEQSSDFELIGRFLDGMLLVLEADRTQLPPMLNIKSRLENARIPILGAVINRDRSPIPLFIRRRMGLGLS